MTARPVRADDAVDMHRLHTDHRVMGPIGGAIASWDEAEALTRRMIDHWGRHGYGVWVLRLRDSGGFVGRVGLRRRDIDGVEETELMCALAPDHWGQGYATEAARAVIGIAVDHLRMPSLVAGVAPADAASRRLVEKLGFVFERDMINAGRPQALHRLRAVV
nr:GNAT family N-acetyltransferase [Azospirillum oleiclasticum]